MDATKHFTDVIHGTISYSGIEAAFIGTPAFNRLHHVLQSSLVFLTYPSNKVKRFEHSIGTMKLSGDIFFHSVCNTDTDDIAYKNFFNKLEEEITDWINNLASAPGVAMPPVFRKYKTLPIKQWEIPTSAIYNEYIPSNIGDYKVAYLIAFQAIRLCGLLHDVGHLPFSHILENFLKKLYYEIEPKKEKTPAEKHFVEIIHYFMHSQRENELCDIHENVGIRLFEHIKENIRPAKPSDGKVMFFEAVCYVAQKILESDSNKCPEVFKDMHLIVSGVVDSDRMDYCNRDHRASGTKNGIMNYDRLLSGYRIIEVDDNTKQEKHFYFSPNIKNIPEIENLIKLRWDDFNDINFHHRVHKYEILLEEVLITLAHNYFEYEQGDVSHNSLADSKILPLNISSIWEVLDVLKKGGALEHLLIQMDDNWLNTLLKQEFFGLYGKSYTDTESFKDKDWNQFHELISAQKHYYSMIKRDYGFREFDSLLYSIIKKNLVSEKITEESLAKYKNELPLRKILTNEYVTFLKNNDCYAFNSILKHLTNTPEKYLLRIEEKLNKQLSEDASYNVVDIMIRKCQFSLGYSVMKKPVYVHSNDGRYYELGHRSRQLKELQDKQNFSPYFHIYYLPKFNESNFHYEHVEGSKLLGLVANTIAELFWGDLLDEKC